MRSFSVTLWDGGLSGRGSCLRLRGELLLGAPAGTSIGYATGFVKAANGFGYAAARVTTPGLGTADLSLPGGRYTSVVSAGANKTLAAKHPTLDEQGTASIASLAAEAVASIDITVTPVPPSILSVQPPNNATNQPLGSVIRAQFSEALDPASVSASSIRVEVASASGGATGIFINGTVALSPDHTAIVLTPSRPLPINVRLLCSFTGGVRDAGGTPYSGALPYTWSFTTTNVAVTNSNIDPSKIRLLLPDANGTAQIIGEAGAIPSGWGVSADIDGPVICPSIATVTANSQGAFTYTVGCPPTVPVTIASKVYLKVFDPQGNVAANIKLGPFTSADGRGVVAEPGIDTVYRTPDGIELTVPGGAFDVPTLISMTSVDPATMPVTLNADLKVGAFVKVDFEGRARKTLRVKVPLSASAIPGRLVFVGEPISLPWGEKLKLLDVARVLDAAGGQRVASNLVADQPGAPSGGRAPQAIGGPPTPNPYCLATLPCGAPCSPVPAPPVCNATLPPVAPPQGCTVCSCDNYICSVTAQLTLRSSAAFIHSDTKEVSALAGSTVPDDIGGQYDVLYTSTADAFVFVPPPNDWTGDYLLPAFTGVPFSIVKRDPATGWIVGEKALGAIGASPNLVEVPAFDPLPLGAPELLDARPFEVIRFPSPSPSRCITLKLELSACQDPPGLPVGSLELEPTSIPLSDGSQVVLRKVGGVTQADATVSAGTWSGTVLASSQGAEMLAIVTPGELDPDGLDVISLTFDTPLTTSAGALSHVTLSDCGAAASGACQPLDVEASFAGADRTLQIRPRSTLPRGHRFVLKLTNLTSKGSVAYSGPLDLRFATRKDPAVAVGTATGPTVLGDTDGARDLLKIGNLLFVGSLTGNLLALDLTAPLTGTQLTPALHAVMSSGGDQIRTLVTDSHNRVFFSQRLGASWTVRAVRVEDVKGAVATTPVCVPPAWAASGTKCFAPVEGGARVSFDLGAFGGLDASAFVASLGDTPTGMPTKMEIALEDEEEAEKELTDFYAAYRSPGTPPAIATLAKDDLGFVTFDVRLDSTRYGMPAPSEPTCGQATYFYQRITVENRTTGQSWSYDVPVSGAGVGASVRDVGPIRARAGDKLRVRYNKRALGYLAVYGSGITVVDLNRFYRTPPPQMSSSQASKSACGRRLASYEGQSLSFPICGGVGNADTGLGFTPSLALLPRLSDVDVYSVLTRFGAIRTESFQTGGALDLRSQDLVCLRDGLTPSPVIRDVVSAGRIEIEKPNVTGGYAKATPDLVFYSASTWGVLVYEATSRQIAGFLGATTSAMPPQPIGRLGLPTGYSVYRLQLDLPGRRLYGGGFDPNGESVILAWDLRRPYGDPAKLGTSCPSSTLACYLEDPRLVLRIHAPWNADKIAVDESGTGLIYTWGNGPQPGLSTNLPAGGFALPASDPRVVFYGRYRGDDPVPPATVPESVWRPTDELSPLGVPTRATVGEETHATVVGSSSATAITYDNTKDDQQHLTPAFKVRVSLPAGLGGELKARIQSLRVKPTASQLFTDDVGALCGMPGGAGFLPSEAYLTLRRLSDATLSSATNEALGETGSLYESLETVLVVGDPRAKDGYQRQTTGGQGDEKTQCRRCDRPPNIPAGSPSTDPIVEVLAAGPYLRLILASPLSPAHAPTQAAAAFFDATAGAYHRPAGLLGLSGYVDEVASATQASLDEPVLNAAYWHGEAGESVSLTSGEAILTAVDHATSGRGLGFRMDRTHRSGFLGYGALGVSFTGSLLSHLREIPLYGRSVDAAQPGHQVRRVMVEYRDGGGNLYRFVSKNPDADLPAASCPNSTCPTPCPAGYDVDSDPVAGKDQSSYCVPQGLYVHLQKLSQDRGFRLIGPSNDVLVFDGQGRLLEIRDRLRRRAPSPSLKGNTVALYRDAFGQLVRAEDDLGRGYSFQYDERTKVTGPTGQAANPQLGLLKKITDFSSRTVEYTWDDDRRLLSVAKPEVTNPSFPSSSFAGANRPTVRYEYNVVTIGGTAPLHDDFGKARVFGYRLPPFGTQSPTNPPLRVSFQYDPATARVTRVDYPGGGSWKIGIPTGAPAVVNLTTPWNATISNVLSDGRVVKTDSLAETLKVGDATPAAGALPPQQGLTTTFAYEADGRLKETVRPDGSKVTNTYRTIVSAPSSTPRMWRAGVEAVKVAVNGTAGLQGLSPYTETTESAEGFTVDNIPSVTRDAKARTLRHAVPEPGASAEAGYETGYPPDKPASQVTSRTDFDAFGRPTVTKVVDGATTLTSTYYSYYPDARGNADAGLPLGVTSGMLPTGDPDALTEAFTYDAFGNVRTHATSEGLLDVTTADEWGRPIQETLGQSTSPAAKAVNATILRAYDAAGHLVVERRSQNGLGDVDTTYTYSDREELLSVTTTKNATASGSATAPATTQYHYASSGLLTSVTSPSGFTTTFGYDLLGRRASVTPPGSGTRLFGYDPMGREVYRFDGDDGVWRGRYDAWGRLFSEERPGDALVTTEYDEAGGPRSRKTYQRSTTTLLSETRYLVNGAGQVERTEEVSTTSIGQVHDVILDKAGRTWQVVLNGRPEEVYEYDPQGRVKKVKDAFDNTLENTYGPNSWPISTTTTEQAPSGISLVSLVCVTNLRHDVWGRVVASKPCNQDETRFTLDEAGRVLSADNDQGVKVVSSYDGQGRLLSVTRPGARGTTSYGYDLDGRLVKKTAAGLTSAVTSLAYDTTTGRLQKTTFPDGTEERILDYYPDDTVKKLSQRSGLVVDLLYDDANRVVGRTPGAGAPSSLVVDGAEGYLYDALGRRKTATRGGSAAATVATAYDDLSRPISETVGTAPLTWDYDPFGNVKTVTPPLSLSGAVTYQKSAYDKLDRLQSVSGGGLGGSYSWGGYGRLYSEATTGALGVKHRFRYHLSTLRLDELEHGAATTWATLTYGYRGDGVKLGRTTTGGVLANQGWSFMVDGGVRLTDGEAGNGSLSGLPSTSALEGFHLDFAVGDELRGETRQTSAQTTSFGTLAEGRVSSRDGAAYQHDAYGNRTEDDRYRYVWTWRGELDRVTVKDCWPKPNAPAANGCPSGTERPAFSGLQVRYAYDALGRLQARRRMSLQQVLGNDDSRQVMEERAYVWDGGSLLSETASDGGGLFLFRKSYLPGPSGLDDTPQVKVEAPNAPDKTFSFLRDELGSVLALVDDAGSVTAGRPPAVARYLYTPLGEARLDLGPELRRVYAETSVTNAGGTSQNVTAGQTVAGSLVIRTTVPLLVPNPLRVERYSGTWDDVTSDFVIAHDSDPVNLLVMRRDGWEKSRTYRVRLTPQLTDEEGRALIIPSGAPSYDALISVPPDGVTSPTYAPPPFPFAYDSMLASTDTLNGRFPGGQNLLFQGAWTDPMTGLAYHRARWYQPRDGVWLQEDPAGDVDSPNQYAYVGWAPHQATDPTGEVAFFAIPGALAVGKAIVASIGWGLAANYAVNQAAQEIDRATDMDAQASVWGAGARGFGRGAVVGAVGFATGGWGGLGARTFGGALLRGALGGVAGGVVTYGAEDAYARLVEGYSLDPSGYLWSGLTGGALGAVGGSLGYRVAARREFLELERLAQTEFMELSTRGSPRYLSTQKRGPVATVLRDRRTGKVLHVGTSCRRPSAVTQRREASWLYPSR